MLGDLDEWLKIRQWDSADINSKLTKNLNVDFKVVIELPPYGEIVWSGTVNRSTLRCTQEQVRSNEMSFLNVEDGKYSISDNLVTGQSFSGSPLHIPKFPIVFEYQGSILSQLKDSQINLALQGLKKSILQIRSLDLLSPELLRSRTKESDGKLGLGGEKLSSFIHESGKEGKKTLMNELKKVYSQLDSIDTKSLRSGWKQLEITEHYGKQRLKTTARHMNDGMLRLMAVLAQLESGSDFLLFDEIENGINPELIEYLIDQLINTNNQIMVTTHSPMILNFMEDADAKKGVVYLYKTDQGFTKAMRLFDIPSMAKKLEFMGPGEVFIDTDLTHLFKEIATLQ